MALVTNLPSERYGEKCSLSVSFWTLIFETGLVSVDLTLSVHRGSLKILTMLL